ncbi:carbonic anhydrase [Kitasatospora sp. NBC_01266]|uniref:carbonic anhydrase n=1 Tax=Kitasatospora sp. NBC_01266 TaxID=2903572 RepID=UPI002E30243B|nr:carbonic anhydrase [Kitasatospora sp. NBC_01266]
MNEIADGFKRFKQDVFPVRAELFARLATVHRPTALFIGCSDSRVVPELITQREPGELFVIRTAGNLVPPYAPGADGIAASIEYAIGVLGVADVVLCGHSDCGAMTALASDGSLDRLPAVAGWLRHADAAKARTDAEQHATRADRVAALVRANVRGQLANLMTHPVVVRALAQRTVRLHGWVYDIGSGAVEELDSAEGQFVALAG